MTECSDLSERMAEVALGRAAWSTVEADHLAGCAPCAAEWRLVRAGAALHASVAVNAGRIALEVTHRLRETPAAPAVPHRLTWRSVGLVTAAAASIALVVWVPRHSGARAGAGFEPESALTLMIPELNRLSDKELESVQALLGPAAGDATPGLLPHLEDLTDSELEQLLSSVGGE